MNKAFENIIEKLEELHERYVNQYGVVGGNPRAFSVKECMEIVQEVAEEYKGSWIDELIEAKKNCGEDSDCSKCPFGQIEDRCILTELQIANNNKGGWIACSERLPEESGYYLVTYHDWSDGNFLPKYDDTYVRRLHYQISKHFVGWNYPKNVDDRTENDCHKEVIAWQPLPEPFKERD